MREEMITIQHGYTEEKKNELKLKVVYEICNDK